MQPIIKEKVRILRPVEYTQFLQAVPHSKQVLLNGLLLTGMRYVEAVALQANPQWIEGTFIKTVSNKAATRFKERWVHLSSTGQLLVPLFANSADKLPTRQTWDENLKRWAVAAGVDPAGICSKTTRKTWESWLVFTYPERQTEIGQSQGHDSLTQARHYLNMPFTAQDKADMRKYVEGWQ